MVDSLIPNNKSNKDQTIEIACVLGGLFGCCRSGSSWSDKKKEKQ